MSSPLHEGRVTRPRSADVGRAGGVERLKGRGVVATAVTGALAAVVAGALLLRPAGHSTGQGSVGRVTAAEALGTPVSPGDARAAIARLQRELRSDADEWPLLSELGLAYLEQARGTLDPSWYPKAEQTLQRSLELEPGPENSQAMLGLGILAGARHRFAESMRWSERALDATPHVALGYGVKGDAAIGIGRYGVAQQAFQQMVDLKPDLASYARVSYILELKGNVAGAIRAMKLALDSAGMSGEPAAWTAAQLGKLYLDSGRIEAARTMFRLSSSFQPDFYLSRAGLAQVAFARGHRSKAIKRMEGLARDYPLPQYATWLGELYESAGNHRAASRQFALVRAMNRLYEANGVTPDVEVTLFLADHGSPARALSLAKHQYGSRSSVGVADAYAWALHAAGRDRRAWRLSHQALRLGTRDALFHFHAGMIARSLGRLDDARRHIGMALRINPHFSFLYASEARRVWRELRS